MHHIDKRTGLYIVLASICLGNALLAELLGVKIFSLEGSLGINPVQWAMPGGYVLDFNLTAGVLVWPVVFITSDIINEYFGTSGVRRISIITAIVLVYAFVMTYWVTGLQPAAFWMDINSTDSVGHPLNINESYNKLFRQSMGIMVGSVTAFLIGQMTDAYLFRWFKRMTGSKMIWLRATGSTLVSQWIDSFVVLWIAFYLFGNMPLSQVLAIGVMNYVYKFVMAVALTPTLYAAHWGIRKYLGIETEKPE